MKFLLPLLVLILSAAAAPYQHKRISNVLKPSEDPFYTPPTGYESQPVGTILKSRKIDNPVGFVVIAEKLKATYQFIVRSEDTFGNAIAIATSLYIPIDADPSKLLSYQVAEDSANLDCAPSYSFQLGSDVQTYASGQIEQIFTQAGLAEGWYVVVPDYEGPNAAFGATHLAGKSVLNSVRAILSSGNITGIDSDASVSFWGYSGGSLATGWASLLEPTYAPELSSQVVGYAYGGIVADLDNVARFNMGKWSAGFIFAAINGLAHEYPTLSAYIKENIYPSMYGKFTDVNHICETIYIFEYAFNTWTEYCEAGEAILDDPIVRNVTSQLNMSTLGLVPTAPLYFYNAKFDEIIPAADADTLYSTLCKEGVSIEYHQDLLGGHLIDMYTGCDAAFLWLKKRMNGKAATTGCVKKTSLTSVFTKAGLTGFSDIISAALWNVFLDFGDSYESFF